MPILSIVSPEIPAEGQDKFLAALPTILSDIKSQPGVAGVTAGQIVGQDGAPVTDFKFVQAIAFKTAEDEKTFADSAWSQEQKARYLEKSGDLPAVGRFEVPEFPADKAPPAYLQYSTLHIEDESKHAEARKVFEDVIKALGKEAFGGRTIDQPFVGLGIIGWDSLEEAGAAFKQPEVAALWAKYLSLGKGKNIIVRIHQ
ncbi:predicted protein [Verticillium alfalfae VaMs.102]|uniref:Predicted protein n=1 Tax=Verticillium alfalfae (strain VaMs.102 / ATCC MYA-4576 / FGSC 10136) TaxID=526221 RepID=C9SCC8_VERA1|nr:predicted protein [Verticillium alfalfae VaMs.102]EEY16743.1 predicted protein [Verticillium alfalfae VaMs.102]